jgi:[ribosomal protein S18]-alanine N-acetyltransferase
MLPPAGPIDAKYVTLKIADPDNSAEIAAIHMKLFNPPWDESGVRPLLEAPAAVAFVARVGIPPVTPGFIIGQLAADMSEIISIGVAEDWQKRGMGRILFGGFARAVSRAGAKRIFLDVAADNEPAIALYKAMGCAEVGRRKAYYQRHEAPAVDAIVMSKGLEAL